jgi:pyruvate/2-oxoglutarate dehydrogenase complex dihydrolipoamide acyltransferase (E2) component
MSTSSSSPLARVKEEFGGKDKLVDKLVGLVDAGEESKDDLRKRLLGAANSKLLRLHIVASKVKEQGGHDKLAAAAASGVGHGKDKDYVAKLESFSNGRLVDMLASAERRAKRKSAAPAKTAAPKAAPKAKAEKATKKPAAAKAAKSSARK